MGICFEVESLLNSRALAHPRFRNPAAKREWQAQRQDVIRALCQHLGWERLPWDEPAAQHGREGYCCSWSHYTWLRALAVAIATKHAVAPAADLVRMPASPFLHLTDRRDSQYTALYLPVDVALPFQIDTSFYWERCTIGSAIRLRAELRELGPLVRQEARQPTKMVAQASAARWEALLDVHRILLSYAQESIDLQQPLFMTW